MADNSPSPKTHRRVTSFLRGRGRDRQEVRSQPAVLASAAIIRRSQLKHLARSGGKADDWQAECWDYYDALGELRFGVGWLANALSRVRLYVGVLDPEGAADPEPTDDPDVRAPLAELFAGATGHGQMLSRMGTHLSVPGETYLLGFDHPTTGERVWSVNSTDEFTVTTRDVKVTLPDSGESVAVDLDNSTVIRLWRPHPRRGWDADSPIKAARTICKEITDLSSHVQASAESRLAGAGVLLVPHSATVHAPVPAPAADEPAPVHEDSFVRQLIEAMVVPITDRDAASAVVPIVLKVPDEAIPHIKHLSFTTKLDEGAQRLREGAVRRLATTLDMPAEVLLGLGDTNHWSAWSIEEGAIKLHVEPLLGIMCDALTQHFLWPALQAMGKTASEARQYAIWYDVSELALRPNLSEAAQSLHDKGLLSGAATRRETGFGDDDAPTANERIVALLEQLAAAGNVEAANQLLLILAAQAAAEARPNDAGEPGPPALPVRPLTNTTAPAALPATTDDDTGAPAGDGDSGRSVPTRPADGAGMIDAETARRLGLVEMAVLRALERAGNWRLSSGGRSERGRHQGVSAWLLHTRLRFSAADVDRAMDGAWSALHQLLPDEPSLVAAADEYVRALLSTSTEHRREYLYDTLVAKGCLRPPVQGEVLTGAHHHG